MPHVLIRRPGFTKPLRIFPCPFLASPFCLHFRLSNKTSESESDCDSIIFPCDAAEFKEINLLASDKLTGVFSCLQMELLFWLKNMTQKLNYFQFQYHIPGYVMTTDDMHRTEVESYLWGS